MAKKKNDDDDEVQDESTSDGSIAVNDAWTGLLAISLLALMAGTGFLAWDYYSYNDEKLPAVPKLVSSPPGVPEQKKIPDQKPADPAPNPMPPGPMPMPMPPNPAPAPNP